MYGYYGSSLKHMLSINYYQADAPYVNFESPTQAYANWDFSFTRV